MRVHALPASTVVSNLELDETERCDSEPLLMERCGVELFGTNLGQATLGERPS